MRTAALPLIVALLAGCDGGARGNDAVDAGAATTRPAALSSADPPVAASVVPGALDELLASAPKAAAQPATGADGGTAIGTDTGLPASSAQPRAGAAPTPTANVTFGKAELQSEMSGPSIERAARAQLYWKLVQRCRDREGKILPPESVHLVFKVDSDGYISGSTIVAEAKNEAFATAARCMQRELSTATFRAPASARGTPHTVNADVPSVD